MNRFKQLLVSVFLVMTVNSYSCECDPIFLKSHFVFYYYDAIQIAEIVGKKYIDEYTYQLTLRNLETFKGDSVSEVTIIRMGSCGIHANVGEIWLFCSCKVSNYYQVGYCNPSKKIEDINDSVIVSELDFFRNPHQFPDYCVVKSPEFMDYEIFDSNLRILHDITLLKFSEIKKMKSVYFKAVLTNRGTIENIEVIKNEHFLDSETFNFYKNEISKNKDFKPMRINGNPINFEIYFPLRFP